MVSKEAPRSPLSIGLLFISIGWIFDDQRSIFEGDDDHFLWVLGASALLRWHNY